MRVSLLEIYSKYNSLQIQIGSKILIGGTNYIIICLDYNRFQRILSLVNPDLGVPHKKPNQLIVDSTEITTPLSNKIISKLFRGIQSTPYLIEDESLKAIKVTSNWDEITVGDKLYNIHYDKEYLVCCFENLENYKYYFWSLVNLETGMSYNDTVNKLAIPPIQGLPKESVAKLLSYDSDNESSCIPWHRWTVER